MSEKKFPCTYCGDLFKSKNNMYRHRKHRCKQRQDINIEEQGSSERMISNQMLMIEKIDQLTKKIQDLENRPTTVIEKGPTTFIQNYIHSK